jgi:hypothetical protein
VGKFGRTRHFSEHPSEKVKKIEKGCFDAQDLDLFSVADLVKVTLKESSAFIFMAAANW